MYSYAVLVHEAQQIYWFARLVHEAQREATRFGVTLVHVVQPHAKFVL
jgi:hypothetical protein